MNTHNIQILDLIRSFLLIFLFFFFFFFFFELSEEFPRDCTTNSNKSR